MCLKRQCDFCGKKVKKRVKTVDMIGRPVKTCPECADE